MAITRLGVGGPSAAFPEFLSKETPFNGLIIDIVGYYEPEIDIVGEYLPEIDVVGEYEEP